MKRWKVTGNVSEMSCNGQIVVRDIYNDSQAPVILNTGGQIFNYLEYLNGCDDAERYMRKRFTYCSICWVRKIEILNDGKVVKTITDDILGE